MNVNAKGEWRQDVVTRSFESKCEKSTFHNNVVSINRTLRDMSFTVSEKTWLFFIFAWKMKAKNS